LDERYERLSAFERPWRNLPTSFPELVFDKPLAKTLKRPDGSNGGRSAVSGGSDVQYPDASGTLKSIGRPRRVRHLGLVIVHAVSDSQDGARFHNDLAVS